MSLLSLASCKTKYVPIEYHHYHQSDSIVLERDTLIQRDSVYLIERGDTVIIRETRHVERIVDRERSHNRVDSLPPPAPDKLMPAIVAAVEQSPNNKRQAPTIWIYLLGGVILILMIKTK